VSKIFLTHESYITRKNSKSIPVFDKGKIIVIKWQRFHTVKERAKPHWKGENHGKTANQKKVFAKLFRAHGKLTDCGQIFSHVMFKIACRGERRRGHNYRSNTFLFCSRAESMTEWGIEAVFDDNSGNWIKLHQNKK
jgi:hypothetical protein